MRKRVKYQWCVIGRPIVNYNEFPIFERLILDTLDCPPKQASAVVRGITTATEGVFRSWLLSWSAGSAALLICLLLPTPGGPQVE
jgi:hypothetical protein